jgi:hypothetical protein
MQRRVRRLSSHLFVICRRQCSAQAKDSAPVTHDSVSIGNAVYFVVFAKFVPVKAYSMTGDVSVRVQQPESPHLVPCSFDARKCLASAGAQVAPPIFTLNRNTMISANYDSGNDYDTLDTLGHLRWMMQK